MQSNYNWDIMKKKSILCIITIVICVLGPIGYIHFIIYDDDFVAYLEYFAYYEQEPNLDQISKGLERNNISFRYYKYNTTIECNFGDIFNNISIRNTQCTLDQLRRTVILRLYDADKTTIFSFKSLDDYKPDLKKSMEYITKIIHNETGIMPIEYNFHIEDGAPLRYPS